jgi:hypothetical protein
MGVCVAPRQLAPIDQPSEDRKHTGTVRFGTSDSSMGQLQRGPVPHGQGTLRNQSEDPATTAIFNGQ